MAAAKTPVPAWRRNRKKRFLAAVATIRACESAAAVARLLKRNRVRGYRLATCNCPIALYLERACDADVCVSPLSIGMRMGATMCDKAAGRLKSVTVDLGRPASLFVQAFDRGRRFADRSLGYRKRKGRAA